MNSKLALATYVLGLRLFRMLGHPKLGPINVTVSVTGGCNSRCQTCFIWQDQRSPGQNELTIEEFERIFRFLGKSPFWFTFSGGEPFLRADLPEICESAVRHCRPSIINIPSNGLLPEITESSVNKIIQALEKNGKITLIINLSLDGLGSQHDEIRGVKGNFGKVMETYKRLEGLRSVHPCLKLGFHSVVSRFNVESLLEVYDYVKTLHPDSYIIEIAEERSELFNKGKDIAPSANDYERFVEGLSRKTSKDFKHSGFLSRIIQSYRAVYYGYVSKWLRERRQTVPCYAAYASCQITSTGEVWPCCILGYDKPLGNLRESGYDFRAVWSSRQADEVRAFVRNKNCSCPLANAQYTNMLCNFSAMTRILLRAIT